MHAAEEKATPSLSHQQRGRAAGLRRRTSIGPYDEAGVVWEKTSQPVRSGLEVALVAGQVHQGDHLAGARNVVRAGVRAEHAVVQHLAVRVQLRTPADQSATASHASQAW